MKKYAVATLGFTLVANPAHAQQPLEKNIIADFGATCNGAGDDNPAFTAFNSWAKAQSSPVVLNIPSGAVCMFSSTTSSGNWFAKGIKKLTVKGHGATLSDNDGKGNGFFGGGIGVYADDVHASRLAATVEAGAIRVTLKNRADTSRFTTGTWALMAGLDLMGYGFPPNPAIFEYVQINSIDPVTGTVTFAAPLRNTYKITWPVYYPGDYFQSDQGGPATLYMLDPSWDTEIEYQGLTISQAGQTYANGRKVTYRDVTFTGGACGIPTQNLLWEVIDSRMDGCGIEVDKIVDRMVISGGSVRGLHFQSASVNEFVLDGVAVHQLKGTPVKTTISRSTLESVELGAYAYGVSREFTCTDCVIREVWSAGFSEDLILNGFTMKDGVISVPRSLHGPVTWAVPGATYFWVGYYLTAGSFTVLDVTADEVNTYVHTSHKGGFPALPQGAVGIRTHPMPKFTCVNCTGSADAEDLSQARPGAPLYSSSKRTYSGNIGTNQPNVNLWGKLISLTVDVTTPYTGAQANVKMDAAYANSLLVSNNMYFPFDPLVDLRTGGVREITPSKVTGAATGDSNLSVPGPIWITDVVKPYLPVNIGADCLAKCPTVTITWLTDHGLPSGPGPAPPDGVIPPRPEAPPAMAVKLPPDHVSPAQASGVGQWVPARVNGAWVWVYLDLQGWQK